MKIIRNKDIDEIPASHEDTRDPGAMKKVLFKRSDLFEGRIQMINWATLLPGKSFRSHFHEDMHEVFIMMGDGVRARVDGKEVTLARGDALVVDAREMHEMKNPGDSLIEYIVLGIA